MYEVFKALSDPLRLRIVNLLQQGELCVCDLEAALEASQSNVSRHLSKLKNAGVVSARKQAQWIYYRTSSQFAKDNAPLLSHIYERLQGLPQYSADLARLEEHRKLKLCEEYGDDTK